MNRYRSLSTFLRMLKRLTALGALLLAINGCAGITPDGQLPNTREEGPEKALFSGPDGEFVILAPANKKENTRTGETATPTK